MRYKNSAALLAGAVLATASLMLAVSAQPLPPTSPPQPAPVLPPAHVVDLLTADGMAAFGAQWKSMDVKIIEGPALPNAMPGYKTSYDISPHAGVKGFDDFAWPTLEPKQLLDRRGGGKVSFLWYRTNLTMPAKIGNFDTANAKAVLTAYVDDYAEVWVNGEMPRRPASPARPPSRASTSRTAWSLPIRSRPATKSRSRSSASMGRSRSYRRISYSSARRRWSSTNSALAHATSRNTRDVAALSI